MFVNGCGSSARNNPSLSNRRRDSAPEICCWVGFKKERNTSFSITYLYMLVLLLQYQWWILRVKSCIIFFPVPKMRWGSGVAGLECSHGVKSIFGAAGAVFGAHIFAVMWCIDALSGAWAEVERGVLSVTRATPAQSFHFLLESLSAEPELEARPGSCFVACGSLWRVYFWKAAEGVGLWFSVLQKAACGRTSKKKS